MDRREELIGGTTRQGGEEKDQGFRRRMGNRILGNSRFVEEVLAEEERGVQERALFKRKRMNVEVLMNLVSKKLGVNREEIIGGS